MQKNGAAAHINRANKKRILPPLPEHSEKKRYFFDTVKNSLPNYSIYLGNGIGKHLSHLDTFLRFYRINLLGNESLGKKGNPIYLKSIIDNDLLSTKSREFTEEDLNPELFKINNKQIKTID